jgi:hypothetical protein
VVKDMLDIFLRFTAWKAKWKLPYTYKFSQITIHIFTGLFLRIPLNSTFF